MKKIINWMLAIIMICGSSVVMSCGDDDEDKKDSQLTPNTYEVTLSTVLPESAAEFYTLDLEYTDADGNTRTVTVKASDKSDAMSDKMKALYEKTKESLIIEMKWDNKLEKKALFDQLIVKNVSFIVPAGKSFSYKATPKVRENYATPSGETFAVIRPFVYLGSKRISGNSQDNSVFTENLGIRVDGSVETEHLAEYLEIFDGKVIAEDARTMN